MNIKNSTELELGCPISNSEPLSVISTAHPNLQRQVFPRDHPPSFEEGLGEITTQSI